MCGRALYCAAEAAEYVGDAAGFDGPFRDMCFEGELSVKPYAKPA